MVCNIYGLRFFPAVAVAAMRSYNLTVYKRIQVIVFGFGVNIVFVGKRFAVIQFDGCIDYCKRKSAFRVRSCDTAASFSIIQGQLYSASFSLVSGR